MSTGRWISASRRQGCSVLGTDSNAAASDVSVASRTSAYRSLSSKTLGDGRHAGSAATAAEQRKTPDFTRREHVVNALLAWDGLSAWELGFEFRPFVREEYGETGSAPKQIVQELAQCDSEARSILSPRASVKGCRLSALTCR
jgi:hypothetical protein